MFVAEEGNPQIEDGRLRHDQFRQALVCQQHLCVSTTSTTWPALPLGDTLTSSSVLSGRTLVESNC